MMCFRAEIVRRNYACHEDAERRSLALEKAETEKASLLATGFINPPLPIPDTNINSTIVTAVTYAENSVNVTEIYNQINTSFSGYLPSDHGKPLIYTRLY